MAAATEPATQPTLHATAIAIAGRAAIIRGASGAGKSDLALRCIAGAVSQLQPEPAGLVADDRIIVERHAEGLRVRAPDSLAGLIEVRGLGILRVPFVATADVRLIVDLVAPGDIMRLPDPQPTAELLGVRLPLLRLAPFEASAPIKLRLALSRC